MLQGSVHILHTLVASRHVTPQLGRQAKGGAVEHEHDGDGENGSDCHGEQPRAVAADPQADERNAEREDLD